MAVAKGKTGQTGQTKFHYGWVVVGITFVTLLVAAGLRSGPAVLIVPLEQEFGWSRATISFAIAAQLLLYGADRPRSRPGSSTASGCASP